MNSICGMNCWYNTLMLIQYSLRDTQYTLIYACRNTCFHLFTAKYFSLWKIFSFSLYKLSNTTTYCYKVYHWTQCTEVVSSALTLQWIMKHSAHFRDTIEIGFFLFYSCSKPEPYSLDHWEPLLSSQHSQRHYGFSLSTKNNLIV